MIEYKGILIETHPEVYKPSKDTFLFLENLDIQRKDEVLEIGAGTGLIAIYTAQRTKNVVATDISEEAVRCALKNTINNKTYNIELKQGNLFEPLNGEKYDLILFNSTCNNTEKIECINTLHQFLEEAPYHLKNKGRVQLLHSSIFDIEKTKSKLEESGFEIEVKENGSGNILINARL
ncbi:methyltransferase [Methanobacterium alcaliphilum]|uniref:methyltransferase n=1 Tax=Methanobacterium alcaliphilum TaxID=392018 RepID=UPI00200A9716|nr:methyltransferase [Methanobacterium alcaliphilum]MCK9150556.1 methyltransferase [Methanobacterium alcaliphilum]